MDFLGVTLCAATFSALGMILPSTWATLNEIIPEGCSIVINTSLTSIFHAGISHSHHGVYLSRSARG
jgi:hypothetical protein